MKTTDILLRKFGDRYVPLDRIAPEYFGVADQRTINRMALKREFDGLIPFRARQSAQAPWLVDIQNLAEVLDKQAIAARK